MLKDPWHTIVQNRQNSVDINYSLKLIEDFNYLSPPTFPRQLKEIYLQAESLFQHNEMHTEALAAQIIIAYLSLQTGEEKYAIKITKKSISDSINFPPDALVKAIYIMASGYCRIGNLDHAFKMVCENGILVSRTSRTALPWIPSHMLWLKSQIMWKMYLYQNHPELWCGPPIETGLNESTHVSPSARDILRDIDAAKRLLPTGSDWPFNDILALALKGIDREQDGAHSSAQALEDLSARYREVNPVVSGWARLGSALVHFKSGMHKEALHHAIDAGQTAQKYQLETLLRNALIYECRLREIQSDYPGALAAQKNLSILHLKSISGCATPPENARLEPRSEIVISAPTYLHNAIKYINSHIRTKINVIDVAEHCQVSRRTLEISFRKHNNLSIFEFIKRKRMHLAADALLKAEMPMHRLAQELGYSSQAVFSRDFSRHHGLSPRNWLRHQQPSGPYTQIHQ